METEAEFLKLAMIKGTSGSFNIIINNKYLFNLATFSQGDFFSTERAYNQFLLVLSTPRITVVYIDQLDEGRMTDLLMRKH